MTSFKQQPLFLLQYQRWTGQKAHFIGSAWPNLDLSHLPNNSMPTLPLLAGWLDLDMLPQTFTEPIISLNSLIARKKLKNGLIIGLEPEQHLSKLSWLRTGLKDSNSEGFLAWGPPCCLFFICGQKESSRMPLLL